MLTSFYRMCQLRVGVCLFVSILVATGMAGCGGGGVPTAEVRGSVRFDGQPVVNGDIMFYPRGDATGFAAGASIKDGNYVVENKGGVPLGEHEVVIRAFQGGGGNADDMFGGSQRRQQYLPAQYSDRQSTELIVTISSDKATHQQDFDLSP